MRRICRLSWSGKREREKTREEVSSPCSESFSLEADSLAREEFHQVQVAFLLYGAILSPGQSHTGGGKTLAPTVHIHAHCNHYCCLPLKSGPPLGLMIHNGDSFGARLAFSLLLTAPLLLSFAFLDGETGDDALQLIIVYTLSLIYSAANLPLHAAAVTSLTHWKLSHRR